MIRPLLALLSLAALTIACSLGGKSPASSTEPGVLFSDASRSNEVVNPKAARNEWVSDGAGNPLPGITLTTREGLSAVTDANGGFRFTGLAQGENRVRPELPGYEFSPTKYDLTVGPGLAGASETGNPEFWIGHQVLDAVPLSRTVVVASATFIEKLTVLLAHILAVSSAIFDLHFTLHFGK